MQFTYSVWSLRLLPLIFVLRHLFTVRSLNIFYLYTKSLYVCEHVMARDGNVLIDHCCVYFAAYCFWLRLKYFITDFKWLSPLLPWPQALESSVLPLPRHSLVLVSCVRGSRVQLGVKQVLPVPVIYPGTCLVLVDARHHHSTTPSLLQLELKTRFSTKNQLRQNSCVERGVSAEQLCKYEGFKLFASVTLFCSVSAFVGGLRLVIGKASGMLAQADLRKQLPQCLSSQRH